MVISVLAVVFRLNVDGLLQEVPAPETSVKDLVKPLSVAIIPAGYFTTEPISARYVLDVTEILAAKTIATNDKTNFAAKIQLPRPTTRESRLTLPKLCLD